MIEPDFAEDETERLAVLRAYGVLDTSPETEFENLTKIAARLFDVPIALISLVDECRQWFKAKVGLDACETPRSISFCGHALVANELLVVRDATQDERFADNPLVTGELGIRFYAGAPLRSGKHVLGTLCVIDQRPRDPQDTDLDLLQALADEVVVRLDLRQKQLEQGKKLGAVEAERSELERTLAILAVSEERYRCVLESAVETIITFDPLGTIQSANPAASTMFGYDTLELLGQNVGMLIPDPDASAPDYYLEQLVKTGEDRSTGIGREVVALRKSGDPFPAELSISEMETSEGRLFTGMLRDISERKEIERMKSEFISTVSHELRTPLTSIRGALGLLLGKGSETLSPKARKMLSIADRNSERLTLLINDLLDLEKIESSELEFVFECVDLIEIAQRAIEENEVYARECSVRLVLVTELQSACVRGDVNRLAQVVTNLISNASKFSLEGGQVEVVITSGEDVYRVTVHDHGEGVPEAFRARIFQRFAQADSSDSRQKGGTGLGLSICKAIVETHGGMIDFTSETGIGAAFYIELPAWQIRPESGSKGQGHRVLICEDDPDVAEILCAMLASENVVSDVARSAGETQSMLAKHTYSLLLLDLNLPDADGLDLLRDIRVRWSTADLPVIVVSGKAEEGRTQMACGAIAVIDWIQKPVDADRLRNAVQSALLRSARPNILHLEDDPDTAMLTQSLLDDIADVTHVGTLREARAALVVHEFDLVLIDLEVSDGSGTELLVDLGGTVPVVIFSASEAGQEIANQVSAALTKSKTSNDDLLTTVMLAMNGQEAVV